MECGWPGSPQLEVQRIDVIVEIGKSCGWGLAQLSQQCPRGTTSTRTRGRQHPNSRICYEVLNGIACRYMRDYEDPLI